MSVPKHLGITILLGSLLAACASVPKKEENTNAAAAAADSGDELVKLAKERAAQGGVKARDETKDKVTAFVDTSELPELPPVTDAQKKLAAPVLKDYQAAVALMKDHKYDEAYALFDKVQDEVPMFLGPVLNQALIRIQQKNFKEAELILKKATGINEKNPYIYNLQGFVFRQQGKFTDAKAAYEKALTISPKYAKAHFNLGVLADLYLQDLPFALQHYEAYQALQSKPDVTVAKWVVDLQKRTGVYKPPVKPAKTEEVTVEGAPAADATAAAAPGATESQAPAPEGTAPAADGSAPAVTPAADGAVPAVAPAADGAAPAAATAEATAAVQPAAADSKKTKTKGKKGKKPQVEAAVTAEPVKPAAETTPAPEGSSATPAAAGSAAPATPAADGAIPAVTPAADNAAPTAAPADTAAAAQPAAADSKKTKTKGKKGKKPQAEAAATAEPVKPAAETTTSAPAPESAPTAAVAADGSAPAPTAATVVDASTAINTTPAAPPVTQPAVAPTTKGKGKKAKNKGKKPAKGKKASRNVSSDTAPSAPEAVKSAPASTTAAGAQP